MKRIALIVAAAGIVGFAGAASAHHKDGHDQGQGKAFGQGCSSVGATESSPGKWFQALNQHPFFGGPDERFTPKEMTEKEYNDPSATPRDLMEQFCGPN